MFQGGVRGIIKRDRLQNVATAIQQVSEMVPKPPPISTRLEIIARRRTVSISAAPPASWVPSQATA